jgi:hypothetical protein
MQARLADSDHWRAWIVDDEHGTRHRCALSLANASKHRILRTTRLRRPRRVDGQAPLTFEEMIMELLHVAPFLDSLDPVGGGT